MSDSRAADAKSRRVIREDLLTNILVEAGAGSGKTEMLAQRMAAGVATGVYQVERMAAVTFTRKAASELRGRFHLALENRLRDLPRPSRGEPPDANAGRLNAALGNLERFFAGTIHSFCARLLRERPVEAGVSPGFTELDEIQDLELRKRSWREFIANCRAAGDPDMLALLETGVKPGDLDSAFGVICLNDDVEFPPGEGICPDHKSAWKALEKFWKGLEKHLPSSIDRGTTCPIQKAALGFRAQLRVSRYRLDRPATIASLMETWDCESKIVQYRWADTAAEKRRFKAIITPLHETFHRDVVEPYLSQWRQYVYRLSVTMLTRAREHAIHERRRLNTLNYGDLLNVTARVLRENAHVRRALQQKYSFLFVDEFQDTDPVQAEIVFLLAADERSVKSGRGRTDWRKLPLRPGALFVVGDPKQSIYRFRRADIEIYNVVHDRFSDPATGRVLSLTLNFRSRLKLCEWANKVFETRFPKKPSPHSPRYAPLDPNPEGADQGRARKADAGEVFTLTHTCDASEVLGQNADSIAHYIRAEVDAGRRRFSDFLILTRRKAARIVPYATALEALNVPIEVSGAGAFGKSAEVETLRTLLRTLADPQDALALVAVLRGPLFGASDRELFAYRQNGGWFNIFPRTGFKTVSGAGPVREQPHGLLGPTSAVTGDGPAAGRGAPRSRPPAIGFETSSRKSSGAQLEPESASGPRVVEAALATLHQYYRWTRVLPAAAAFDRILEHSGYLALAATTAGGVEAGDLLHALDRVRQVIEEGGSLSDAGDALDEDAEETSEVESLPLEPGRTDVVRIMNLHKAKGLEADVVFLADPLGGFNPRVDVHISRTGATSQGWFQVAKKFERSYGSKVLGEHADWPAHQAAELPYLEHEVDRLLYVAATRARQVLVISRWSGNARTPAWGVLNDFLADARELKVPAQVHVAQPVAADCSSAAQAEALAAREVAHARLREATWSITSVTAEAHHVARMVRQSVPAADDPTGVVAADTPTHRADAGMAWGTLIHGLLEHAMRHPNATRDDLKRLAMWLTVEEPQLRAVIDEAVETVRVVADEGFWRAAQLGEHLTEAPFVVAEGQALLNGVVDLVFKAGGAWAIRDYKTDFALKPDAYRQQLDAYTSALKKLGIDVGEASIVQVRQNDAR